MTWYEMCVMILLSSWWYSVMEVVYLFFKVLQPFIVTYMVCQYWMSVILYVKNEVGFHLLPYHYDLFRVSKTWDKCDKIESKPASNWAPDAKLKCFLLHRKDFRKFQKFCFDLFPLVENGFWQKSGSSTVYTV